MTQTGMFVGTVDYIAPEQVEGRRLDARADIYALGCVTYELLTGRVPFPRDSDVAKIFAHVNDPPPRLDNVPEPLAVAVQRAMAKRPEDRFQSAGDFGRAVSAGAVGQVASGGDRAVATGDAAIADAHAPTELAGRTPVPLAYEASTEVGRRPPPGRDPSGGAGATPRRGSTGTASLRRPGRRWPLAALATALVLLIGAGVAIALAASGSSSSSTTTTTTTASTSSSSTSTSVSLQATAKQIYSPANASGGLAVTNPRSAKGSCFTTSNVTPRSDAYRCMSANNIYDPCFFVNQGQVLCPTEGPWADSGLLLNIPSLPNSPVSPNQGTGGQPWAIQLADGNRCLAVSGATNLIAGQRLGYFCKGGVGLYGNVQRSAAAWTIFVGTPHSATLAMRPLAIAWF